MLEIYSKGKSDDYGNCESNFYKKRWDTPLKGRRFSLCFHCGKLMTFRRSPLIVGSRRSLHLATKICLSDTQLLNQWERVRSKWTGNHVPSAILSTEWIKTGKRNFSEEFWFHEASSTTKVRPKWIQMKRQTIRGDETWFVVWPWRRRNRSSLSISAYIRSQFINSSSSM